MVTHQLKVELATGKVRRPKTDVLPLSMVLPKTIEAAAVLEDVTEALHIVILDYIRYWLPKWNQNQCLTLLLYPRINVPNICLPVSAETYNLTTSIHLMNWIMRVRQLMNMIVFTYLLTYFTNVVDCTEANTLHPRYNAVIGRRSPCRGITRTALYWNEQ